jgi:hypothetical protein
MRRCEADAVAIVQWECDGHVTSQYYVEYKVYCQN